MFYLCVLNTIKYFVMYVTFLLLNFTILTYFYFEKCNWSVISVSKVPGIRLKHFPQPICSTQFVRRDVKKVQISNLILI